MSFVQSIELGNQSVCIVEDFVGFVHVQESTGIGLTKAFLHKIDELGLSISNCRGQGYDNGANMRGRISGVQARILELNKRALFVPCSCHSLNLVLGDMANSSVTAVTFFWHCATNLPSVFCLCAKMASF